MSQRSWDPPPEKVTLPDQIDEGALDRLEFLSGERIARCWRSGDGFLVMTNLRCVLVFRRRDLLRGSEWQTGPDFFFFNLLPPHVLLGHFLELSASGDSESSTRLLVRDPEAVRGEIEAARPAGRAEWERHRAQARADMQQRRSTPTPLGPAVVREIVREIVRVRCRYCGNLMDETATVCPSCGARQ